MSKTIEFIQAVRDIAHGPGTETEKKAKVKALFDLAIADAQVFYEGEAKPTVSVRAWVGDLRDAIDGELVGQPADAVAVLLHYAHDLVSDWRHP